MHQSNRNSTRHHIHPEERIWARANAPGPGRSEDQARQDETILHDWHGAKNMVISSYQKSANLSRLRRKNLSRNEKSDDTANKNRICRRLADTRDLKSLSGDRVRVQAPPVAWESSELFVDSNDSGLSLFAPFFGSIGWARGIFREKRRSLSRA